MQSVKSNPKSLRKPLRNVTNNNGVGRSFKLENTAGKKFNDKEKEDNPRAQSQAGEVEGESDNDSLDSLLLVQSNLSALVHQIDELVAEAFTLKAMSNQGRKEVESFADVLSGMLSSLKPWIPRFKKVLSSGGESENRSLQSKQSQTVSFVNELKNADFDTIEDSLISPSPLVSWRANCNIDRERQMFLLTPLPITKSLLSKQPDPSELVFKRIIENTNKNMSFSNLLESVAVKEDPNETSDSVVGETKSTPVCGFVSSLKFSKVEDSIVVMTPLTMSPPKTCVLLEPIPESSSRGHSKLYRSTPYPVGIKDHKDSDTPESSGSESSHDLASKYPELLAIQKANESKIQKKQRQASPDWFVSPPKTCVLLELPDDKAIENTAADNHMPEACYAVNNQMSSCANNGHQNKISRLQEVQISRFSLPESTPILKEPGSTARVGKHPGESTLKKELWTKFEAATTNELWTKFEAATTNEFVFKVPVLQETNKKGFLERLDEVSCDDEI